MKISDCLNGAICTKNKNQEKKTKKGFGLIDRIIDKLPEIHIPGYQYCGPGTDLEKRLARGDPGINKLDKACKDHDIAYATCNDSKSRRKADKDLVARAFKRTYSRDAKLNERAAALAVSTLMSTKMGLSKIGLGLGEAKQKRQRQLKHKSQKRRQRRRHRTKTKTKNKKKSIAFSKIVRNAKKSIQNSKLKSSTVNETICAAIRSAKSVKRGKMVKLPRILKLPPYTGGVLPILPILTGLSAVGSITASTAGIVKAIKDIGNAKKQLEENRRHSRSTEQSGTKIGRGLYLTCDNNNKKTNGSGFYLKPYQQQRQYH